MSFAGHVLAMIQKQRENRILQKQNRDRLKDRKNVSKITWRNTFNKEKFPPKSESEIIETKTKIRAQIVRDNRMAFLKTVIFIIVLIIVYLLVT